MSTARAYPPAAPHTITKDDVRRIRHSLELTQKAFAALLDVHLVTVQGWEGGGSIDRPYQRIILGIEQGITLPSLS